MWLLLTAGFRRWLLFTVVVPLAGRLARRLGVAVDHHGGPAVLSKALTKAADATAHPTRASKGTQVRRGLLSRSLRRRG